MLFLGPLNDSADRFDLVVVAGDRLDIASIVPLQAQIIVVRKYLQRLTPQVPIPVCSGNHDILSQDDTQTRDAAWLRGKQIGSIPCFTVIDTENNKAMWMSAAEAEQAELTMPLQRQTLG
ncbi:MAG: putative MPP superfamily phosphohydrolase [Lentimonas sp.]|jgi:predicted MPP superfamily phosphohydrolase